VTIKPRKVRGNVNGNGLAVPRQLDQIPCGGGGNGLT
jgi:hypothetical protein